jgi:hypothetical protein
MTSPQSQDNSSIEQSAIKNVTVGGDLNAAIQQNVTIHQVVSAQPVAIAATLNTTLRLWMNGRDDRMKSMNYKPP